MLEEENNILREKQSENPKNEETANTTTTAEIAKTAEKLDEKRYARPKTSRISRGGWTRKP